MVIRRNKKNKTLGFLKFFSVIFYLFSLNRIDILLTMNDKTVKLLFEKNRTKKLPLFKIIFCLSNI